MLEFESLFGPPEPEPIPEGEFAFVEEDGVRHKVWAYVGEGHQYGGGWNWNGWPKYDKLLLADAEMDENWFIVIPFEVDP